MSYLDPRGGYAGEWSSDSDAPETYAGYSAPAEEAPAYRVPVDGASDPYAAYRFPSAASRSWDGSRQAPWRVRPHCSSRRAAVTR